MTPLLPSLSGPLTGRGASSAEERPASGLARLGYLKACLLVLVATACQSNHQEPASQPSVATPINAPFDAPRGNFSATLPGDWKKIDKGGDYVLALVPEKSAATESDPILSVQYPDLPPHIPGMLPIGSVADGYVNDLRKRFSDEKVDDRVQTTLDGAPGRHLTSSFTKGSKPFREVALLAVHGDHVYVITATCPTAAFDQSQAAFNQVTGSWKWKP